MKLVIVESPYAGDIERNVEYAQRCMHDCLMRGEAPFASHLLYTQPNVLDDANGDERRLGMEAGFAWGEQAAATIVYEDLGITKGMDAGISRAKQAGRPIIYRTINGAGKT